MVDAALTSAELEGGPAVSARRPAVGYALVLVAVSLWAVNGTVGKIIVDSGDVSALRLAELRSTGAGLVLFVAVALVRPATLSVSRREVGFLAVFGIGGLAFVHFLYFVAITHLDIGIALVIQYIAPVLVALWARFFVHEPVRRRLWLALALALAGLSLVVELWSGTALDGVGVAASLAAACAYALYILMAERSLQRGRDVFSLLAWGFIFATAFWTIAQPWWSFPWSRLTAHASLLGRLDHVAAPVWLLVGYVVMLGTVVPFVLMITALHHIRQRERPWLRWLSRCSADSSPTRGSRSQSGHFRSPAASSCSRGSCWRRRPGLHRRVRSFRREP